jgi:hypothetical protein
MSIIKNESTHTQKIAYQVAGKQYGDVGGEVPTGLEPFDELYLAPGESVEKEFIWHKSYEMGPVTDDADDKAPSANNYAEFSTVG